MSGLGSSSSLASVWTEGSHITAFRKQQELQSRLAREVQQRFYSGAAVCVASFDIAITAYLPRKQARNTSRTSSRLAG